MVSNTCATCQHKASSASQTPCVECIGTVFDGNNAFSKWEPIPPKTIEKENNNGNTENT